MPERYAREDAESSMLLPYSSYGVGFVKPMLYAADGGPALYLRPDLVDKQYSYYEAAGGAGKRGFHPDVWSFATPFVPPYAPAALVNDHWRFKKKVDYSHEREWRVPHDFTFEYSQIEFVVVATYEDVAKFPASLKDEIGRERFLMMDVYQQISERWPIV
jgi:hypothetical protein